jgi:UDPglucose 6-dehydrogenase
VEQLGVLGAGYVGLVTAACLAELGHRVTCVEVDERRLTALRAGQLPIYEPGLAELVWGNAQRGRLLFTGDFGEIADADAIFVAVPTPSGENGEADISFVREAVYSLIPHAKCGVLLIIKSTVPVGTADGISQLPRVLEAGIEVVSNPEFLRQGTAVQDFLQPERVVIGAESAQAVERAARIYASLEASIIAVDRRSAELAKYTANALLATRISFMNEISHIATAVNADIDDVARIVGMDRRIGPAFLRSGLGWGGSCFPKDVLALTSTAALYACHTPILRAVYEINELQREHAAQLLIDALQGIDDPIVALLGVAFKPNTDDVRGSPALTIARRLIESGVAVRVHDPFALPNARQVLPGIDCEPDPYSALNGADALLLATEWEEYETLDWTLVRETMRGKTVIDGRNVLNRVHLTELGFDYRSFGRPGHKLNGNGTNHYMNGSIPGVAGAGVE